MVYYLEIVKDVIPGAYIEKSRGFFLGPPPIVKVRILAASIRDSLPVV